MMKVSSKWMSVVGLALLAGGCAREPRSTVAQINTEPLTIDPAMQAREWEPSMAYYANGDTKSPSTGFAYQPRPDQSSYTYAYADLGTYFVNLVTMPYTLVVERDGINSTGEQIPPTYTAVPPLPPRGSGEVGGPMKSGAAINSTGGPAGQGTGGAGTGTGGTGTGGTGTGGAGNNSGTGGAGNTGGTGAGGTGTGTGGTGAGGTGTGGTGGTGGAGTGGAGAGGGR